MILRYNVNTRQPFQPYDEEKTVTPRMMEGKLSRERSKKKMLDVLTMWLSVEGMTDALTARGN